MKIDKIIKIMGKYKKDCEKYGEPLVISERVLLDEFIDFLINENEKAIEKKNLKSTFELVTKTQ